MRFIMTRALLVLVLVAAVSTADGFSGPGKPVECPICQRSFVSKDIGFGPPFSNPALATCPRCLYSSLAVDFNALEDDERTAIRASLTDIEPRVQSIARDMLGTDAATVRSDTRMLQWLIACSCYRDRHVARQPPTDLLLRGVYDTAPHGSFVYWTGRQPWPQRQSPLYQTLRQQAITRLEQELADDTLLEHRRAFFLLTLGQLHQSDGEHVQAVERFHELERFIAEWEVHASDSGFWHLLPVRFKKDVARCLRMSLSKQMTATELEAELAKPDTMSESMARKTILNELASRRDKESWDALTRYATQSASNLEAFLVDVGPTPVELFDHPELSTYARERLERELQQRAGAEGDRRGSQLADNLDWFFGIDRQSQLELRGNPSGGSRWFLLDLVRQSDAPLIVDHRIEKAATIAELAELLRTAPGRLRDLNPDLPPEPVVQAGRILRVLRVPQEIATTGWGENAIIGYFVRDLILLGSHHAAEYFGRWIGTLGEDGLSLYGLPECIRAVAASPETISIIAASAPANATPAQKLMLDALAFAAGSDEPRPRLLERLEATHEWNGAALVILTSLETRRDAGGRAFAGRMAGTGTYTTKLVTGSYLSTVGTVDDVAAIESALAEVSADTYENNYARSPLEYAIRTINLRAKSGL